MRTFVSSDRKLYHTEKKYHSSYSEENHFCYELQICVGYASNFSNSLLSSQPDTNYSPRDDKVHHINFSLSDNLLSDLSWYVQNTSTLLTVW